MVTPDMTTQSFEVKCDECKTTIRYTENLSESAAGGRCGNCNPQVGMGATMGVGSDSYPYTVIAISKTGKTITVQADNYRRTDRNGQSESQEYEYTPNPQGSTHVLRRGKNGRWVSHGRRFGIGSRRAYSDPSF